MVAFLSSAHDQIAVLKPASIFDKVPRHFFLEDGRKGAEYIRSGNCYEWKYAVSAFLRPKKILEIGVRYGYSLASFAFGSPKLQSIEGWDACLYDPESNAKAGANLAKLKDCGIKCSIDLRTVESSTIKSMDSEYDLVHIDGSHIYETCLSDLRLCLGRTRAILIDDVFNCREDANACRDFTVEYGDLIEESVHISSIHGDWLMLLR